MARASVRFIAPALLVSGCSHSSSFPVDGSGLGPFGSGANIQLTFNPDQDYWPAWTEDGRGILYAFAVPGSTAKHRCLGILPAAGGTRVWEMCDNRAVQDDSTNSFAAYALSSSGKLLYVTAVSDTGFAPRHLPKRLTFWLADTAAPYQRTALLSFPYTIDVVDTKWFTDLRWTGANSFIGLQQLMSIAGIPVKGCDFVPDSLFGGGQVVAGTIANGQATLQGIAGTDGATAYSLAENGTSIVFTRQGSGPRLFKVPFAGGSPVPVSAIIGDGSATALGVACRGTACVVATDNLILAGASPPFCLQPPVGGTQTLYGVDIAAGTIQSLLSDSRVLATPAVSPINGDVVVQIGGQFGHVQTTKSPTNGELHLLAGLIR